MRKNPPARPVDDRREIDEALRHRNVGYVHRPDMVGLFDLQLAQEIGINLVSRRGLAGVRAPIDRLDPHALHQCHDMAAANRNALAVQQIAQHSAPRERVIQMQLVDPPHDLQVLDRDGPRLVIDGGPADVQSLRLPGDGKIVIAVDHRFALSMPALVSAPSKKSFSSVSSPILACSDFTSTAGVTGVPPPGPKISEALASSCDFHVVIWLGWTSKCSANWAMVRSPLTAARATLALKAGEWFRRGRLLMVSPVHGDCHRCQAEICSDFRNRLCCCQFASTLT